jgi:hypothetical protein
VLQNESIMQTGTYDEIVRQEGNFAELAKRQVT